MAGTLGSLRGKVCVVTGATSGIGRETALGLARLGATVAIVARDEARGAEAIERLRGVATDGGALLFLADLASLAQVRRVAGEIATRLARVDVLVHDAGAVNMTRKRTVDGLETTFAVNHLAPFLLTALLRDRLRASAPSRIVTVASDAHRMARLDFDDLMNAREYSGMRVYAQSKLANVMFTYALARRLEGTGVTANALHPGVVATGFGRNDPGWLRLGVRIAAPFFRSPERGARTPIWLAASPEVAGVSGRYFADEREVASSAASRDVAAQERLWAESARLVGMPDLA